ncbi:hypothetical protein DFP72DRAFT_856608 [Ephemerocybe angulata]|uniref:Uncharacterized protein n=1 Tax=Ephemerocybe angulata TaxID=980116 RepID=A0A8H6HE26_9AGAR|nr:hypothetical protein DFP72DRAFT_856608 [Tulosesus angulatus]
MIDRKIGEDGASSNPLPWMDSGAASRENLRLQFPGEADADVETYYAEGWFLLELESQALKKPSTYSCFFSVLASPRHPNGLFIATSNKKKAARLLGTNSTNMYRIDQSLRLNEDLNYTRVSVGSWIHVLQMRREGIVPIPGVVTRGLDEQKTVAVLVVEEGGVVQPTVINIKQAFRGAVAISTSDRDRLLEALEDHVILAQAQLNLEQFEAPSDGVMRKIKLLEGSFVGHVGYHRRSGLPGRVLVEIAEENSGKFVEVDVPVNHVQWCPMYMDRVVLSESRERGWVVGYDVYGNVLVSREETTQQLRLRPEDIDFADSLYGVMST